MTANPVGAPVTVPPQKRQSCLRAILSTFLILLLMPVLLVAALVVAFIIADLTGPPSPAGYRDGLFESAIWTPNDIGAFLGVELPTDSDVINISGKKGNLGSYGMLPTLEFSFRASPENTLAFARQFCGGVFYPGFNPLVSQDSSAAAADRVLIRGAGTIHYASSPDVPITTIGNRCERPGTFWIEEFAVDMSDPDEYVLTYRLPNEAQASPGEYYPQAGKGEPLGYFPGESSFPLYVTGLRGDGNSLIYPTFCLETVQPSFLGTYWDAQRTWRQTYDNSEITIFVDDIPQPQASIESGLLRQNIDAPLGRWQGRGRWEYCISENWSLGQHVVRMVVTPQAAPVRTLQWSFAVLEPLQAPTPFIWPNAPIL